ncbi:ATP-binding protein [Exiguobacterium sp. s142]|uniref:sensor histidine kinase n=1 Tax=Exiguobacterium sp. s142 TaxID=2751222 RepID=UPI001BE61B0F|nr:ATP-binding protein [Exiguobacterium sp. s142]
MKHWIEQRISRQVLTVFYVLIVLISVPSLGTYFYTQQAIDETMVELERISEQRARATDLFETWQSMQYEMRGHVLLGEASLLDEVRAAQSRIDEQTTWFEQSAASAEEVTFATEARLLFTVYTSRVMPGLERYVIAKANGEVDEPFLQMETVGQLLTQIASSDQTRFNFKSTSAADMSASIVDMESIFTDYRSELDFQEIGLRASLSEQLAKAQWSWLIILLGALFTLFISLQPYIVRLTNQLQALITNSERLAVDPHALLVPVDPLQNEVGQLSRSFNAMSSSLIKQHDELEREREKTARIVHTMRDAIVFVKTDTGQRYANAALFDLYEQPIPFDDRQSLYPIEEFYRPFMDQIDDQEGLNRFTNRAKHEGIFDETFTYSMQGGTRIIRMYAEPIELQDERVGVIFVLRDVTKEIEVDRLKTELVATVSHELRTPLTSILGFTELLEHRHVDELKRKRYLGMINSETRRLERLVSDLLDVQKMEAGKVEQDFKVESLFELLSDVLEVHAGSTELHAFHFECDEEIRVSGDPAQLRQVFSNILNNAIKYSPDGGNIAVNVSREGDVIRVAIEDEGIGVTAEDAERLFEKFYRVQNEQSRNIGGTGLGLAICKEIIESHGGTISVRSKSEQGTTIIVELPIVE